MNQASPHGYAHSPSQLAMSPISHHGDRAYPKRQEGQGRWRKQLGWTTVALAIALVTPGLANGSEAHLQGSSMLTAQSSPLEEEVRVDREGPMHPSLILWIEIVVAVLLLVGLVATLLAYRGIRQTQSDDDESKNKKDELKPQPEQSAVLQLETLFAADAQLEPNNSPEPPSLARQSSVVGQLQQQEAVEQEQLATEISLRLRQSQTTEDLLRTTVKEVRKVLNTDRVIIFGLDSTNWEGLVLAESVAPGCPQILKVRIDDPCFRNQHVEMYK